MKPIKLCLVLAAACISFEYAGAQASDKTQRTIGVKTEVIKVEGVCELCKKRIEKEALAVEGIKSAVWNENTKLLTLKYDVFRKAAVDNVHKKIAAVGYNTGRYAASESTRSSSTCCCHDVHKES
ncbi:MAG: heavy-metal-associated domain-containing protein [Chitinophagaceae bacterium]